MMTMGDRAELALRMVRESKTIAFDTETSGLDWKIHKPVGYVITDSDASIYIPVRHGGGGNLMDPNCGPMASDTAEITLHQFEIELAKAFKERNRRNFVTIGHNLKFDMHMAANAGVHLNSHLQDTQIQAALLDEFMRSYSLDSCAAKWGVPLKKGEATYELLERMFGVSGRDSMAHFWRLPGNAPETVEYAEGDGVTTLALNTAQMKDVNEEDLGQITMLENKLISTVFRMERRGVRIDNNRANALITSLANRVAEAQAKLPKDFNPRSPVSLRDYMESHGHTDWPMTAPSKKFPNGQPSFTEKWLKKTPEGKNIIELRQITNLRNSFIDPLLNTHTFNGRVHSNFWQLKSDEYGTISGRFSSSSPNMQQVPKRNKELGRPFRELFIPDDGMRFIEADYSQCEPRLFAHYSKDPNLVAGYCATPFRDAHQVVADLLGVERDPTAKRMNMGIFTGMQKRTFSEHMGWPLDQASEAFDKWFTMFPGVRDFQNLAKKVFEQRGYVRTIYGRKCRLDDYRFTYKATSRIIQGSNADIVKYKMVELDELFQFSEVEAHLLLTVHDSFGMQIQQGEAGEKLLREAVKLCEDVQGPPFNLRVPFVMDVGSGSTWGEATYG